MKFWNFDNKNYFGKWKILGYSFGAFLTTKTKKTTYFVHQFFLKRKKELDFFGERYDNNIIKVFDKIMWKTK